jgi:hypothetical protein
VSYGKKHRGVKHGAPMGGLEVSPERRKREAKKRRCQEEKWAEKSGPVKVYIDPSVTNPRQPHSEH